MKGREKRGDGGPLPPTSALYRLVLGWQHTAMSYACKQRRAEAAVDTFTAGSHTGRYSGPRTHWRKVQLQCEAWGKFEEVRWSRSRLKLFRSELRMSVNTVPGSKSSKANQYVVCVSPYCTACSHSKYISCIPSSLEIVLAQRV